MARRYHPINWDTTSRTSVQELQDIAITEQEHRWVELKRELVENGLRSDFETNLWHNFDLMQAFDLFSIFVCVNVHTPTDGDGPELLGFTLRSLDQVPGARIIPNVATKLGGERVDVVLRAVEPGVVTVSPYPFKDDAIAVSIEATAIPDRRYADAEEARAAVEAGEKVPVECRMIRP